MFVQIAPRKGAPVLVLSAFLTSLLAGCGQMATAPTASNESAASAPVYSTESASMRLPDDTMPSDGNPVETPIYVPSTGGVDARDILAKYTPGGRTNDPLIVKTATIDESSSGKLMNGRWTVMYSRLPMNGSATLILSTPSSNAWGCKLSVDPASLDDQANPMTIIADVHTVTPGRLANYVILRFDTSNQTWHEVEGSVVNTKKKTVTASIDHFGFYAVGPRPVGGSTSGPGGSTLEP